MGVGNFFEGLMGPMDKVIFGSLAGIVLALLNLVAGFGANFFFYLNGQWTAQQTHHFNLLVLSASLLLIAVCLTVMAVWPMVKKRA